MTISSPASRTVSGHLLRFGAAAPGTVPVAGMFELRWQRPLLMGIVNVTPDSFSDGGRFLQAEQAVLHAKALLAQGAEVLDIGGESSRPGAAPLDAQEEMRRVLPVIEALRGEGALLSIDSYKPEVAAAALNAGAHIVNDISGLRRQEMIAVCAERGAPAIIMHMQGVPGTMQQAPHYQDVVAEVTAFLLARAQAATAAGVPSVVLDPGIGFGKTLTHNLELIRALPQLAARGYPLLLGASRKRFIGTLSGEEVASERDAGSLAVHLWGAAAGAAMLRVHNVGQHAQALKVWQALCD